MSAHTGEHLYVNHQGLSLRACTYSKPSATQIRLTARSAWQGLPDE